MTSPSIRALLGLDTAQFTRTVRGRLRYAIRDHQVSQSEIAGAKRMSQHLSGPEWGDPRSVVGDDKSLEAKAAFQAGAHVATTEIQSLSRNIDKTLPLPWLD
jgi:hypothetical protein